MNQELHDEPDFDIDEEIPAEFELPFADDADVLDLGPLVII